MKKLNAYFPIWFLLILPPLLFVTIGLNAITCSVGVLIVFILTNNYKKYKDLFKSIIRLWCISLVLNLLTFLLLLMPEIFNKVPFIKEKLIIPLETNPYTSFLSISYIVITILIILSFSSKMINKLIINKINIDKEKMALTIMMIFSFPYFFLIPSNLIVKSEYESLEDYRGTIISNKTNVSTILKYLETSKFMTSYVLETQSEPYTVNIYLKDIIGNYQILFEKDASVIFNIIDDVNEVVFHYNGSKYVYTINSINLIYKDVKELSLVDIAKRYKDDKFNEYIYLGNVKGFDVFDVSEFCELDNQYLFSYFNVRYYLNCTSLDEIILYKKSEKINIKDAIDNNVINAEEIMQSVIDVKAEDEE